jgi:hypothetical protein
MAVPESDIERAALWAAVEDYAGLEEILKDVCGKFPGYSREEAIGLASRALTRLIRGGEVEVFWSKWASTEQPRRVASADEALALLSDAASWTTFDNFVCVSATELGRRRALSSN